MIGQKKLLKMFENYIKINKVPKFMILTGSKGYGKKTLCKELATMMNVDIVMFGNKVDDLRECIDLAYQQTQPILYVLTDADTMSVAAKNSILKLIEEPPKNAYIVMLVDNQESILATILSRARVYSLDNYSYEEIKQFLNQKETAFTQTELEQVANICDCPGMVESMLASENAEMIPLVNKLLDNISQITLSNLLKITKKFKINESSEGMDIPLFINCLQHFLYRKFLDTGEIKYYKFYAETINTKSALRSITTNKLYSIDNLLIKGWKIWNCGN